jgi:arylsulfatase A-like enzyme
VDFFLHLPERAALELDLASGLEDSAGATPELRVTLQRAGASTSELTETLRGAGAKRVDLTTFGNSIVRLTLEATSDGGARVRAPWIRGVRAPAPASSPSSSATRGARANLVLVVIDTLRADHLGTYGYPKPTSPEIDAIGRSGLVFENVVAQSSWTTPATASILTGLDPDHHGAHELGQPLRTDATTLAERLRTAGYRTAAFVTNVNVRGELGFQRGFDEYRYFPEEKSRPGMHAPAREVVAAALRWIEDGKDRDEPFFVYLHLSEPHAPYAPDADLLERMRPPGPVPPIASEQDVFRAASRSQEMREGANLAYLKALYDAEIATVDRAIGTLVQGIERAGVGAGTVLAITADHGEELADRGKFGHGHGLHRELVRVPLVLRLADRRDAGRRVSAQARQVDVAPTLLAAVGLPGAADGIDGTSLIDTEAPGAGAVAQSEAFTATSLGQNEASALVTPQWKAIWRMGLGRADVEVFDLEGDPDERTNVADRDPVLAGYVRQSLAKRARLLPRREPDGSIAAVGAVDESVRRRLEMLGYLGMGGTDAAGGDAPPGAGADPEAGDASRGNGAADAPGDAPG